MSKHPPSFSPREKGSVAVLAAVSLTLLLAVSGLVIDLGHYYVVRQQLKNAADAGALAGVRAIYPYDLNHVSLPLIPRCADAVTIGTGTAEDNEVDAYSPTVTNIQTGKWDWKKREFTACCSSDPSSFPNAVRVSTQRADVPLYFMQMFGAEPRTLGATSTAVQDWAGTLKKHGGLGLALGNDYVTEDNVELTIPVNDDTSDKGGWYASVPLKPSDSLLMDYLEGKDTIPAASPGNMVNLNNGVFHNVLAELGKNYINKWFYVPIVDKIKFNQEAQVMKWCRFTITEVGKKSEDGDKHYVRGVVNILSEVPADLAEPGGSTFTGLLVSAKLVQ